MPTPAESAEAHWQTLDLAEQLGNIGSEISRALNWRAKDEADKSAHAFERGLELFDFTLADARWRGRLKELARAREVVCDYFAGTNAYGSSPSSLRSYFDLFALAARKNK